MKMIEVASRSSAKPIDARRTLWSSSRAICLACCLMALLTFRQPSRLAADEMFVQFRDGTVVRGDFTVDSLPWVEISVAGDVAVEEFPLKAIDRLSLTANPITRRIEEVRGWIRDLGGEDFAAREQAHLQLRERGAEFLELLQSQLEADDPEVRWRVKVIVDDLLRTNSSNRSLEFDRVTLSSEAPAEWQARRKPDGSLSGNFGEFEASVKVLGQSMVLKRDQIASIWRVTSTREVVAEPQGGERISSGDLERFPDNMVTIDFTTSPDGQRLADKDEVGDAYASLGVRFSTSIDPGYVSVFDFVIQGAPSRKPAAGSRATDANGSNFKGITTITFHVPGRPDVPATVTSFGCYLAIVARDQTKLRFFDSQGRLIQELATTRGTWDFVGFKSMTPISRVEIHPTEEDPNYAFDDVMFDPPQIQSDASSNSTVSVTLRDGQYYRGASMDVQEDVLVVKELTIGVDEVRVPIAEIEVLVPRSEPYDPLAAEARLWIRTRQGDRVVVKFDESGAHPVVAPEIQIPIEQIQAIWRSGQIDVEVGLARAAEEAGWIDEAGLLQPLQGVQPRADFLEAVSADPRWKELSSYERLPLVILAAPPEINENAPMIKMVDGESWSIDGVQVQFKQLRTDVVTLVISGEEVSIPLAKVAVIRLPNLN